MLTRSTEEARVLHLMEQFPVVAVIGARQVGKTTLAGQIQASWAGPVKAFDLENEGHLAQLAHPLGALEGLEGLIVLDEIQRRPELFPSLRVLADRPGTPARFLILGSASPELLRQSSESLAGRIAYHELPGFRLQEVGREHSQRLWLRGGFPRSFLADTEEESFEWRRAFVRTFLERDLPGLGVRIPARTLRRFWTMLAHMHGQLWRASDLARNFGVADTTVRNYLDLLCNTHVVRLLAPYHANIRKRQVKSPRVYINDTGILHTLLGITQEEDLLSNPKLGASWESFALQEVIAHLGARDEECFFWRSHTGAELDLLVVRGRRRLGFEFKHNPAPRSTRSMHTAIQDLELDALRVIHPGHEQFPMAHGIEAIPLGALHGLVPGL